MTVSEGVREADAGRAVGGQEGSGGLVAALDVGGTAIKAGLFDRAGEMTYATSVPTGREAGPDAVVETIERVAAELIVRAHTRGQDIAAVGVAIPGHVDETSGVAVYSENLGWNQVPLRDRLVARLGRKVVVSHDVRCGCIAEHQLGAGKGLSDFVFVTLGTGIGAAMIIRDRLYLGAHGVVGELGHTTVETNGPPCACGRNGCLEAVSSASSVEREYRQLSGQGISAQQVFERAAAGDQDAATVVARAIRGLAVGIINCSMILDPEVVILGGGLARAGDSLFAPLRRAVEGTYP